MYYEKLYDRQPEPKIGDLWRDPDGVVWKVVYVSLSLVHLEKTNSVRVDKDVLVRNFTKL